MALTRVQGTGKVSSSGTTTTLPAFGTLPTVGNGLVVCLSLWSSGQPTSCQDTRGNTYVLATYRANIALTGAVAIFYCPKIVAAAAPFTITVTHPTNNYFLASATEVSGVGAAGLTIDQIASAEGSSGVPATVSTSATAALTAAEIFVAAALNLRTAQVSIAVEAVSPPWTQEAEELATSNTAGEADTRVLTGMTGLTTSCSWALGSAAGGGWAAALVAFAGPAAGAAGDRVDTFVWMPG